MEKRKRVDMGEYYSSLSRCVLEGNVALFERMMVVKGGDIGLWLARQGKGGFGGLLEYGMEWFGVTEEEFYGKSRRYAVVLCRCACMSVLRSEGLGLGVIGALVNQGHSNVLLGDRKVWACVKKGDVDGRLFGDFFKAVEVKFGIKTVKK